MSTAECFNEQAPTERGHTCVNEPGFMWRSDVSPMKIFHPQVHKARSNCCNESEGDQPPPAAQSLCLTSCLLLCPKLNYHTSDFNYCCLASTQDAQY